ncbi:hypothetical protein GEMRC1_013869 [Eukaryota sp. GEM-RC1]
MGILLTTLQLKKTSLNEVILDFLNIPSSDTCDVVKSVEDILDRGFSLLEHTRSFDHDSSADVKLAMESPTPQNEGKALTAVLPSVELARSIYDFGLELAAIIPQLLSLFSEVQTTDDIQQQKIICRTIARTFDFVLGFDQSKGISPRVLKDVGVYRRLTSKGVVPESGCAVKSNPLKDSELVMILAQATPFTSLMGNRLRETLLSQDESLIDPLCDMCNLCSQVLHTHRFNDTHLNTLLLRTLTGCLLLCDYSLPEGVFKKGCRIHVKYAITALKKFEPDSTHLLSTLKFSSCTFGNSTTTGTLKSLMSTY